MIPQSVEASKLIQHVVAMDQLGDGIITTSDYQYEISNNAEGVPSSLSIGTHGGVVSMLVTHKSSIQWREASPLIGLRHVMAPKLLEIDRLKAYTQKIVASLLDPDEKMGPFSKNFLRDCRKVAYGKRGRVDATKLMLVAELVGNLHRHRVSVAYPKDRMVDAEVRKFTIDDTAYCYHYTELESEDNMEESFLEVCVDGKITGVRAKNGKVENNRVFQELFRQFLLAPAKYNSLNIIIAKYRELVEELALNEIRRRYNFSGS